MKLRDVYILCKQNVQDIEYACLDSVIKGDNEDHTIYVVKGLNLTILAVDRLKKVKCLETQISEFLQAIPYCGVESTKFNKLQFGRFESERKKLLSSIKCVMILCEMMGLEEKKIIGLDIKLPVTSDFSDFRKYIDDLEFIFTKCPFFKHESESLIFKNVDIGSTWLTLAVIGTGAVTTGSILLNNIAAFIDKCLIIRSHHQTIQKQKFDLEKDESFANDKETIIKYLNRTYKKTVDIAIKELEEITNYRIVDGDERGRIEQAFERLEKLIDKGLQIYSTIDSPKETKALFEPLEMKYLEINKQLELLEKKDDEPNND